VAPRAGLPEPSSINALDWQPALSAYIGSKSIFGALANLRWDKEQMLTWMFVLRVAIIILIRLVIKAIAVIQSEFWS